MACSARTSRRPGLRILMIVVLSACSAHAQDQNYQSCIDSLGYVACDNMGKQNAPQQMIVLQWAAVVISPTTMRAGGSHGQNSVAEAEQTALANCRRQGALDCKLLNWVRNQCMALAISYPDKQYGWADSSSRTRAAATAMAYCKSSGGKSCAVIVAPCADDDARFSAPLPLPPGGTRATVDPQAVGTWELLRNPGVWVWHIAANGTYEFHSQAADGVGPQAGTVTASAGKWSINAFNNGWNDVGNYTFQGADTLITHGKTGTGVWRRYAQR
jgi:hypothetical protein